MDEKLIATIGVLDAEGKVVRPSDDDLRVMREELEKQGFEVLNTGSFAVIVSANGALFGKVFGFELTDSWHGHQRVTPTPLVLQRFPNMCIEVAPPAIWL